MRADAAGSSSSCADLAAMPCVFVVALGRTGSTHLLRVLNAIPGYRVSGETDNAWIYLGWWHAAQQQARGAASAPSNAEGASSSIESQHSRRLKALYKKAVLPSLLLDGPSSSSPRTLCAMRQLMLQLHNPAPHARVFGFKEIYSPFVRDPTATSEVLTHGVDFVRTLFPRARFIFHARRNLTRAADSDFWTRDWRDRRGEPMATPDRPVRIARIAAVVARYAAYAQAHPERAYMTTLEGLTDGADRTGELAGLFRFLGETLTPALEQVAHSHLPLSDWVETCGQFQYTARVNGTTQCVEKPWERRNKLAREKRLQAWLAKRAAARRPAKAARPAGA